MTSMALVKCGSPGHAVDAKTYASQLIKKGERLVLEKRVKAARSRIAVAKEELRGKISQARIQSETALLKMLGEFDYSKKQIASPNPGLGVMFGQSIAHAVASARVSAEVVIGAIADQLQQIFTLREQEEALAEVTPTDISTEAKTAFRGAMEKLHPDKLRPGQTDSGLITELAEAREARDERTIKGLAALTDVAVADPGDLEAYLKGLEAEERDLTRQGFSFPSVTMQSVAARRETAKADLLSQVGTEPLLEQLSTEVDAEVLAGVRSWLKLTIG